MDGRNKRKRKIRREEEKHVLPLTNHYVPMEPVVFRNQEEFAFHARVLYNDGQEDILADKTVSAVYGGVQGFPSILQEPFASGLTWPISKDLKMQIKSLGKSLEVLIVTVTTYPVKKSC